MGYDITFHPISKAELKEYLVDVVENPRQAEEKAKKISKNPKKSERIISHYQELLKQIERLKMGQGSFSSSVAFIAAAIAGFLHPYWYARGSCLSFLADKDKKFADFLKSLIDLFPSTFKGVIDKSKGKITSNWTGGGYVGSQDIKRLKEILNSEENKQLVEKIFDQDNLEALNFALDYCLKNKIGLLEASEVVFPFANRCASDFDNFRAHFMKTAKDFTNAREKG